MPSLLLSRMANATSGIRGLSEFEFRIPGLRLGFRVEGLGFQV